MQPYDGRLPSCRLARYLRAATRTRPVPDALAGQRRAVHAERMEESPHAVTVDGHTFRVLRRPGVLSQYDFDWLSGPNEGYGFAAVSSSGDVMSPAEIEESIRNFLAQVDPVTGYIE